MGHLSDTNAPLYKDHLSTETTVGMGHLSDIDAPTFRDHLSVETINTQPMVRHVSLQTSSISVKYNRIHSKLPKTMNILEKL